MKHQACTHCGRVYSDAEDVRSFVNRLIVSPSERSVIRLLAKRPQRIISYEQLLDHLYGDDPGGGPDNAMGNLRGFVHKANKALMREGWIINNFHGVGYVLQELPPPPSDQKPVAV